MKILERRIGGCDTDVAVLRVLAVGEGSARTGELHAGLLALVHHLLCAAVHGLKADEVAAVGLGPAADAEAAQLLLEDILYHFELGANDLRMLPHVLHHAVDVLEEAYMPQLIHLVVADGLVLHLPLDVIHVVGAGGQCGDTGAREGDLRGGSELVNHIRIAGPLALCQNLDEVILVLVIQVMDAVSIVPVNTEVLGCRLQAGKAAHRLVAVAIALGVGVLGNTPDALDGLVLPHQLLHHIHIRTCRRHGHIDHFKAEVLCNAEMPVIAGHRAEPLHLVQLAPGGIAHHAVGHGTGNGVIHHIQGGVSVDDDVVRIVLHHIGKKDLGLLDAAEHAVIPAVRAVLAEHIRIAVQGIHQPHGQVKLLLAGLAAAHVQCHLHGLILLVLGLQLLDQLLQLVSRHLVVCLHAGSPF